MESIQSTIYCNSKQTMHISRAVQQQVLPYQCLHQLAYSLLVEGKEGDKSRVPGSVSDGSMLGLRGLPPRQQPLYIMLVPVIGPPR
jgi:hypothetical protein